MKLSIITASYNSAATIKDTLESVNKQNYSNVEHIIIDGGSKDTTLDIVKAHGKRVMTVISEPDKGIFDAYNKGLKLANGEIIGFLNSDDFYYSSDVLESVMHLFVDPRVEAVYGDLYYVDKYNINKVTRVWKSKNYKKGLFTKSFHPAHPTLFLRKSVYEKVGQFNLTYNLAGDYEFMLRAFHLFEIKSIYLPKVFVRMRNGGATGSSLMSIQKQNMENIRALKENGVTYSKILFFGIKIFDRLRQKILANLVVFKKLNTFPND
jgi:glycosyltransferase